MNNKSWTTRALGLRTDLTTEELTGDEEVMLLLTGSNGFGDQIFCYLQFPYKYYDELKSRIESKESFDPRQYGSIVAAGLGFPSEEVQKEIHQEFGYVPVTINEPEPIPERFGFEDVDDDDLPF